MEREYKIVMHVPIGERRGKLKFVEKEGKVSGTLCVFGRDTHITGTMDKEGELKLRGEMSSLFGMFEYNAYGRINGNNVDLEVSGGRYKFTITGEEIGKGECEYELH